MLLGLSVAVMLVADIFNVVYDFDTFGMYIGWNIVAMNLFFDDNIIRMSLRTVALVYFTEVVDTFTVMLIQIILIGKGVWNVDLAWWMEPAYLISFLVYLVVYNQLLRKNEVYLCDIKLRYKIALLIQAGIFGLFYDFIFSFFDQNMTRYSWSTYVTFGVSVVGVIYSIFLTLSLAIKNLLSDRQNDKLQALMRMQKQQYDYQMQQNNAIRRFRHDLINHIGTVWELMNFGKNSEAKEYIEKMWNITEKFDSGIHTGDGFMDAVINYYLILAKKEKISFEISGKLSQPLAMEMTDITVLIGNILQNAYEASKIVMNPKIHVEIVEHKKEVFFSVCNAIGKELEIKNGVFQTTKMDKDNHGFGMKNIMDTVKKYHGECYCETKRGNKESAFKISVAIPKEG